MSYIAQQFPFNPGLFGIASGAPAGDADVTLWVASVVTNGGTVSAGRRTLFDTFVTAEKAAGTWALTDDYWFLVAENAPQALTSLKQRRLAVAVNTPTFTTDAGYAFNGTTNYIDTGFIPGTHAVAMATHNGRMAVYDRVNLASNNFVAGAAAVGNRSHRIRSRTGAGAATCECNGIGGSFTPLPLADSRGYTSSSRSSADTTTVVLYKNGVSVPRTSDTTVFGTSLGDCSFYIGGYNVTGGVLTLPRACTVGLLATGAALSAGQETSQYNAIQSFMTSVGANV